MSVAHVDEDDVEVEITDAGDGFAGEYTPSRGVPAIEVRRLVESICAQVEADVHSHIASALGRGGGGGGGHEPPPKTFLGADAKGWGGWAFKLAIALGCAAFAWYTWVNKSIEARPTKAEATEAAREATAAHEEHGEHAKTQEILRAHSDQLRVLSEIQIRQTTILENQAASISEMKGDIKASRNHR